MKPHWGIWEAKMPLKKRFKALYGLKEKWVRLYMLNIHGRITQETGCGIFCSSYQEQGNILWHCWIINSKLMNRKKNITQSITTILIIRGRSGKVLMGESHDFKQIMNQFQVNHWMLWSVNINLVFYFFATLQALMSPI